MPKNLFQDMVRAKNSRKEIPIRDMEPKVVRREAPRMSPPDIQREIPIHEPKWRIEPPRGGTPRHYGLWVVAGVCVVVFIFALSFLFAKASVTINPKITDVVLDENLSAVKGVNPSGLSFDLVIISGEETKEVLGGEETDVALKSRGIVILYNAMSPTPQKLAIDTRLEGSNGKIYKTETEITIPAMSADGTPGSVEVGIYGGVAGAEYDSSPLDFKILGFKGTTKYDKFYGRSKGPIAGGFIGKSATISDADKQAAFLELKPALQEKLFKKAIEQIPSGFILFKDAAFLTIDSESVDFGKGGSTVPVKVSGTLYGFLFSEKELTEKIARDNISNYDGSEVYIPNIKDISFSLSNQEISFSDAQSISFHLSGNAKVVWRFDEAQFSAGLLGKKKSEFNQVLTQYPNIDSAELTLSPFWVRSFPQKSKDIKITVNYPQ